MTESDHSRFWIAAELLLGAQLVVLPTLLGGAPEWSSWVLWALSSGALISWTLGAVRNRRRFGWHPLMVVPVVFIVVGLVQLMPLPPALLALLSPRQEALRDFALVPLGLERWRPLAVDPPATGRALARVIALAMSFFVAVELGRVHGVRRRLLAVLTLTGVAFSVCGFAHLLAGLEALFGVWHFGSAVTFLTPFGNANHLAAYFLLTGTVGIGLALKAPSRDAALGWAVAAATCGLGAVFSLSRGGIATFVATWALVGVSVMVRRGGGVRAMLPWVIIGGTVLVAALVGFEPVLDRLETVSSIDKLQATKLELWPMFVRGIAPYSFVGMGLSGFEIGISPSQTVDPTVSFTHPESFWLQWWSDLGAPVALGLLIFAARRGWKLWSVVAEHDLERTALLAVLGLGLHDLLDFSLELNAIAAAAVIVLGLLGSLEQDAPRRNLRRHMMPRVFVPIATAFVLLTWALPGYLAAEHRLERAVTTNSYQGAKTLGLRLIDRHPGDWALYAAMAQGSARAGNRGETLAWVNRVLTLRPLDVASHVTAARVLVRLGRLEQALGEYRLAWSAGEGASLGEGLAVAAKLGLWERVLLDAPTTLEAQYNLLRGRGRPEEARALIRAALDFPPNDAVHDEAVLLEVRHEIELGTPEAALKRFEALPDRLRSAPEVVLLQAQTLERAGRADSAVKLLNDASLSAPSDFGVGFALADLLARLDRTVEARSVLERLKPFGANPGQRTGLFLREAELWKREGRFPRALDALQTVSRLEPTNPGVHYQLAQVYEAMGSVHSALDEVRRGRLLDTPEGAKAQDAWVLRLEAATGVIQ